MENIPCYFGGSINPQNPSLNRIEEELTIIEALAKIYIYNGVSGYSISLAQAATEVLRRFQCLTNRPKLSDRQILYFMSPAAILGNIPFEVTAENEGLARLWLKHQHKIYEQLKIMRLRDDDFIFIRDMYQEFFSIVAKEKLFDGYISLPTSKALQQFLAHSHKGNYHGKN